MYTNIVFPLVILFPPLPLFLSSFLPFRFSLFHLNTSSPFPSFFVLPKPRRILLTKLALPHTKLALTHLPGCPPDRDSPLHECFRAGLGELVSQPYLLKFSCFYMKGRLNFLLLLSYFLFILLSLKFSGFEYF